MSKEQYDHSEHMHYWPKYFNKEVITPGGWAILRNFRYSTELKEISGLDVDLIHGGRACYSFGEVRIPNLADKIAQLLKDEGIQDQRVIDLQANFASQLFGYTEGIRHIVYSRTSDEYRSELQLRNERIVKLEDQVERIREENFRLNKELNQYREDAAKRHEKFHQEALNIGQMQRKHEAMKSGNGTPPLCTDIPTKPY